MELFEAAFKCKVRGYISRKSKPDEKYWKNTYEPFTAIINPNDIFATDWEYHDPEGEETSIVG